MEKLFQDLRYGARMLWKSPGFTLIAVVALALGIGANSAIFSVVNATLLRQLPYRQAERLVVVWENNLRRSKQHNVVGPVNFADWQEQSKSFEGMTAFYDAGFNLTGTDQPEEIPAQVATGNLFTLLGAQAALGRTFTDADAEPGHDDVVVLSYGLWQRRFGGARDVVGKTMGLNGHDVTIIGVMPADFKWFIQENSLSGKPAEFWTPTKLSEKQRTIPSGRYMSVVARLKPGVSIEQAQAEMNGIANRLEQQRAEFNTGWGVKVVPLHEQLVGEIRTSMLVLLGAVGFVLLIACANVANLTLARAAARQKEIAIRMALGAWRWRVVRQLLTESVLLALVGGVFGLLLALWGVDTLVAFSPRNLIATEKVGLNLPMLGFTFIVSLLSGIIFGLIPAFDASRLKLNDKLKETGKSNTGSARSHRVRDFFVVAEIALAVVLLVGAGLMIKSFMRLQAVDPGFDPSNLLTMSVSLPRAKYKEDNQDIAFFKEALERIGALPGVRSVGMVSALPFASLGSATGFTIEGQPPPSVGDKPTTDVRETDENYFRTMNIPVISGRAFSQQEVLEDRKVAIINEALARKYFPNENPIGKRVIVNMKATPEPTEIIGVVGDAKYKQLEAETRPMVYWPYAELVNSGMTIVVRTTNEPLSLAAAAQREIQMIDKDQPVSDVKPMQAWLDESTSRTRFGTLLLAIFAGIALILAAVGIYGVMSYSVNQRTQEIGIRMALGAQASDVLKMVVGHGMMLTLIGVGCGLVGAFALTRVMASLLYGITATDPVTFVGVSVLLTAIALIACLIPARRATKVDPMVALRYE
jgi:putative ABC transport system permease protein